MIFPIVVTVVLLGGVCVSMLLKKKEKKKARDSSAAAQHKSSAVEDHGNRFNIEEEVDRTEVGSTLMENVLPPFLQRLCLPFLRHLFNLPDLLLLYLRRPLANCGTA